MARNAAFLFALALASTALASNLAFHVPVALEFDPAADNVNWVSLPWRYFPDGTLRQGQTVGDLCVAFNGGASRNQDVRMVVRWNAANDTVTTRFCAADPTVGSPFIVVPGEAYMVIPSRAGVVLHFAGSEDVSFSRNKRGPSTLPIVFDPQLSSSNLVSLPYHARAAVAKDLCVMFNGSPFAGSPVRAIVRWNALTSTVTSKFCPGSVPSFSVVPGEGYAVYPAVSGVLLPFDVN